MNEMVFAFIIHTLLPGQCRVLYHKVYYNDKLIGESADFEQIRSKRDQQIQEVAKEVQSVFQFRRAVDHRSVEEDVQKMALEDVLPEMETGFLQLTFDGHPRIAVWQGAGNTGFTLLCECQENRILAQNVLRTLVKFLQEHLRLLQSPVDVLGRTEKIEVILQRFLPAGNLLFMNHRVIRQFEKEIDVAMKT